MAIISDVWEGVLFIGNLEAAREFEGLKERGVTHVVTVCDVEPLFPGEFQYACFDIKDTAGINVL
jgi:hypothetical protein